MHEVRRSSEDVRSGTPRVSETFSNLFGGLEGRTYAPNSTAPDSYGANKMEPVELK